MATRRTLIFYAVVWAIGLAFSLIKGQFPGKVFWGAEGTDFIVVLMAYLYLRSGISQAGLFGFVQGMCVDVYSVGFKGLFVFLNLCALGVIALASGFIHLNNPRGQILIVAMAWVIKKGLFFALLMALRGEAAVSDILLWPLLLAFILTVISAPIVFYFLDRLRLSIVGHLPRNGILQEH